MKIDKNYSLLEGFLTGFFLCFFLMLSFWWYSIYHRGLIEGYENNTFTLIYPLLALFGGAYGAFMARRWGGFSSYFGKSLAYFSCGLLAQFFGQASYAYLIYIAGADPYPSFGDIGYFGSIIFYLAGIFYMSKVVGVKISLGSVWSKLFALGLPIIMLIGSYLLFLRGYSFDSDISVKTLLDFGYPIGQAIYVSAALLVLALSGGILGGIMRGAVWFLVVALITQYIADSMFLYQNNNGAWYVGGLNDYLYLVSYFIMTMSLVYIGHTFDNLNSDKM